ncbi:hypothetical protein DBR32_11175 [Taibaiella sp. KBW10]|uniref:hypothetical protein n=1 Tax=Taibaiella sp. KBW10 TaxID=2153357 RepID=UPI000F59DB25|nr:hypothetical protein [Taibaiella sp. KBW10]RQO30140.1 hypothetical protein DBR32_11175 [Taibaiella sp. KBW10]
MLFTQNARQCQGSFFRSTTRLLRVLLCYSPSLLLLFLFALVLIALPQGSDLLLSTLESSHWYSGIMVLTALLFWSYMLWYSGRIVSYCKAGIYLQSSRLMFHLPRILGFYVYAIVILGFICSSGSYALLWIKENSLPILLISIPIAYSVLHRAIRKFSDQFQKQYGSKGLINLFHIVFILDFVFIISTAFYKNTPLTMTGTVAIMQLCYLFLIINRKRLRANYLPKKWQQLSQKLLDIIFRSVQQPIPQTENHTFILLQVLALVASAIFIAAIIQPSVAAALGSIAILMLAFGFYTGLCNLIAVLSTIYKINILFFLLLCFLIGAQLNDPHKINTVSVANLDYSQRPSFRQYLYQWLSRHQQELDCDTIQQIPMIFIHSDGGASRSGYWVAAVLNRIDSLSHYKLDQNLFALSGASGGSLGNATFFSLLYLRKYSAISCSPEQAKLFLETDFLSYPLVRMLGTDVVNYIYPILPDRSRALEQGIEYGGGNKNPFGAFFAAPISTALSADKDHYLLPILCLNTTRMQDARPGIIGTVKLDSLSYGQRLDVLSLLPPGQDIRWSTAVVLGARFPYISPAGAISEMGAGQNQEHYFVDGGYFDNSGAGIIHEMILELEDLLANDPYLQRRYGTHLSKIKYQVLHISNSPKRLATFTPVNALLNDLAAPLITLIGSYSAQTSANDYRLKAYIEQIEKQKHGGNASVCPAYFELNLYSRDTISQNEYYPMNWVISTSSLKRMQQRLQQHPGIPLFAAYLDSLIPATNKSNFIHKPLNPYLYGLTNLSSQTSFSGLPDTGAQPRD